MRAITLLALISCVYSQEALFKNGTDLAIHLFGIEAKLYNKTISLEKIQKELNLDQLYCEINGVKIYGSDILRTIQYDVDENQKAAAVKVKEICSFRTKSEIFRFQIIENQ